MAPLDETEHVSELLDVSETTRSRNDRHPMKELLD